MVSVLIPARNEVDSVRSCVESILEQDYPHLEVLVLDDDSTDSTGEVIRELANRNSRVRALDGKPLPRGWTGKNWACHQLSLAAGGELLLFTDADTVHGPSCVSSAVAALQEEGADLLTALPHQEMRTWGERLTVPILGWSTLCFFPLFLAHRLRAPSLTVAVGQFMLFRKEAYQEVGGHAAVKDQVADDFSLGRAVKAAGMRWLFLDGRNSLRCRMYQDLSSAYRGLAKSLLPAFGNRVLFFTFVWSWLAVVFLEPPLVLASGALGLTRSFTALFLASLEMGISLLLWGMAIRRLRYPVYLVPLYPLVIALGVAAAFFSLAMGLSGKGRWKDRPLPRPRLRWP
ncbi:MAG: glycosyltransferase [Actinomycetota bacterium]